MSRLVVTTAALMMVGALAAPAGATPPGRNGLILFERPTLSADEPPSDLFTINPDGSGEARIFPTRRQHESDAGFSPVSPLVAFSRGTNRTSPEIFVGDIATGRVRKLTRHRAFSVAPSFSPDGRRIAYFTDKDFPPPANEEDPAPPSEIYTMNADGSGKRRLTRDRHYSFDPDFSPDGRRIVFAEGRPRGRGVQNRLAVMDADGRNRRPITRFGGTDEINPKWTPDGLRIVFEVMGRRTRSDIASIALDGSDLRLLLATPAWETNPIPSPDGTKIVFTSDRDRRGRDRINRGFEVYTMNADGTGVTRLTTNGKVDAFPDWQRLG